ncbi:S-adenosyl-methionine-sterol-C-methyltransferase [Xylariales sp. PMI_506]|nr:S-adenosyl-methionine-sterol-C-methyltransferase [Xylariales sp. PMI_506]
MYDAAPAQQILLSQRRQLEVPMVRSSNSSTDTPRSSSTSASNEKVDLAAATFASRLSFLKRHHDVSVDRSASTRRWKTFQKSFKYLLNLTPKQVDDYMASYVIYNLDWENESEMIAALGPNYQQRVGECLRAYYGVMNHLCALGDVEKMYIPPQMDKHASVLDNQLLNEESIAREIGLKPGMKVLDLGCGRGRVAAHMAAYTGAQVTGLNIDPNQVAQAREFNKELGLQNEFVEHDQNDLPLPFADGTFDAFYEIQALSLCKDPRALFKEVYRVLKPGARFLLMDWVSLPAYNPADPEHVELMRRVKPLIGAVGTPTPASFESALRGAGFVVNTSDIPSIDGLQAPLIDKVDIYFRAVRQAILAAVKLHMLPRHFKTLINRLCLDGQAFVKMDNMRLITTVYRAVAEKPQ